MEGKKRDGREPTKFYVPEEDVGLFEQRYLQLRIRRSGGIFHAKELKT